MRTLWISIALGLLLARSAGAETLQSIPWEFVTCDGYGAPTKSGDGMATALQRGIKAGAQGIAACNKVLADPQLRPDYQLRRAHLLVARAIHRIENGDSAGALVDLDLAAAVPAPHDVFYDRSMALDIGYVRAAALRQLGRDDEAQTIIQQNWKARPYSLENSASAFYASDSDGKLRTSPYGQALARLNPQTLTLMFVEAVEAGDYPEAVKLSREVVPDSHFVPSNDATNHEKASLYNWQERTVFIAIRRGDYAVALAGLGHLDDARAELATAHTELAAAMTDMPAPMNLFVAKEMSRSFAALAPKVKAAAEAILAESGAEVDRIAALPPGTDSKPQPSEPRTLGAKMAQLFSFLPPPQEGKLIPSFGKDSRDVFILGPKPAHYWQEDGAEWVSFSADTNSEDAIAEMALLAAAQRTLDLGFKGFIIINRREIHHSTIYYGLGDPNEIPGNLETQLSIYPVDPDHLPEKYVSSAWRVIEAGPVLAALTPIYNPPMLNSGRP